MSFINLKILFFFFRGHLKLIIYLNGSNEMIYTLRYRPNFIRQSFAQSRFQSYSRFKSFGPH